MSNEYKDYLFDQLSDVLLDAGVIDKEIETIPWYSDYAGVVHGIKDGIHVKYTVYLDDDGEWKYERNDV